MKTPRQSAATTNSTAAETQPNLFAALRSLMIPYRSRLDVVHDEDDHFYANCRHLDAKGRAQFFGAVKVSGRKHVVHFMPVYDFPELLSDISPALKKRMQGKSCFNFDALDPALLQELQHLVEQGVARYENAGKL
ncbi:hypothetical protein [Stenotrophomonas sp.]|uniref:hypothetical protein n=1 Tax=Stenotrophomonas sp. TaxID=69392 RepID=UPI0019B09C6D|nr:hypothetical protein [Stenotrophomonas sp.]MBD3826912.1 hypothetical protein [Stenotrophomonas sp.]